MFALSPPPHPFVDHLLLDESQVYKYIFQLLYWREEQTVQIWIRGQIRGFNIWHFLTFFSDLNDTNQTH